MVTSVMVPGLVQLDRYVCRCILLLTFCHVKRIGNVSVIGDTSILGLLHVIAACQQIIVIAVASVEREE